MTEKRPVPLQHFIIFKEKLHMIKDENNNIKRDVIEKVLREEAEERRKKFKEQDKEKKKKAKDEDGEEKDIDFKQKAMKAKEHALWSVTHNATKN
jgi:superfamily II RNA helicase